MSHQYEKISVAKLPFHEEGDFVNEYSPTGEWTLEKSHPRSGYQSGTLFLTRSETKTRKAARLTLTPTADGFSLHVEFGTIDIKTGYDHHVAVVAQKEK